MKEIMQTYGSMIVATIIAIMLFTCLPAVRSQMSGVFVHQDLLSDAGNNDRYDSYRSEAIPKIEVRDRFFGQGTEYRIGDILCADGNYLYITSYAHQCGNQTFEKGYVAKIDVKTKQVVATCEVGWEPEGVRLYEGKLYVANTGGYAFSENHAYETTVQVVDAETMKSIKTINTGCINLYGEMSQAGQYLCINSCGDYHNVKPKTVIVDCKTDEVKTFDFPATYNTTDGNLFYTIGSAFSYITNEYTYYIKTINPKTREVADGIFCNAITQKIKEITSPYELYISPYTKNVYFTDAGSYGSAGYLYGYTNEGQPVFAPQKTYVNPAHILALPVYENK